MGDRCDKGDRVRRDECLASLSDVLRRISDSGDPSLALLPAVDALVAELTGLVDESEQWDLDARYLLGWLKWYQFEALPQGQGRAAAVAALDLLTPGAITIGVREFPGPLLPALADRVVARSAALLQHAAAGPDVSLLCDVVDHWIHLVNATPQGHPDRPQRLTILCGGLHTRFVRTGNPQDLKDALTTGRRAVQIASGHRDLGMCLSNLSAVLKARYELLHVPADLDEAVAVARQAVAAAEGHPGRGAALTNLGAMLQTRFGLTGAVDDLDEATAATRRALDTMPPDSPDRAAGLNNLCSALLSRFERTHEPGDLDEAVRVGRGSVEAGAGHPDRGLYLTSLGEALQRRYRQSGAAADLDEAVARLEQAVAASAAHPDVRGARHAELVPRQATFAPSRRPARTLAAPAESPSTSSTRTSGRHTESTHRTPLLDGQTLPAEALGKALQTRFERTGTLADLDRAVAVLRQAVAATPPQRREYASRLLDLSMAVRLRFLRTRAAAEGDEAVDLARAAVAAVGDTEPDRLALMLVNLGSALLVRHERTGSATDLDEAVASCRRAVETADGGDALGELHLTVLDQVLWTRFSLSGTADDLDETVATRRAVTDRTPVGHAERSTRMRDLSAALLVRFMRQGRPADLDDAITADRAAVEAAADDHERTAGLASLSSALYIRFLRSGASGDGDEAMALGRLAVEGQDDTRAEGPMALQNLSKMLLTRSRRTGSLPDLDESVSLARRAAEASSGPPGTGDGRDGSILVLGPRPGGRGRLALGSTGGDGLPQHLASCLIERFERTGSTADADDGIRVLRRHLETSAVDPAERVRCLMSLSIALRLRSGRSGERADLDQAVEIARTALDTAPADSPEHGVCLGSLSNALHMRFTRYRDAADLDEAVGFGRRSVAYHTADEPDSAQSLMNLCDVLQSRFQYLKDRQAMDEAVDWGRRALEAIGPGNRSRPKALLLVGTALHARAQHTRRAADSDEALRVLGELVRSESAPPGLRIEAARLAAGLAAASDLARSADLLETAVLLLPELASHRLRRHDQEHAIESAGGLADTAAALALADPTRPPPQRARRALSLLEAGRAVLLSQTLDTRGDLAELHRVHPALASRYAQLRDRVDRVDRVDDPLRAADTAADAPDARADPAARMTELLQHIRTLDGFTAFALPPSLDELRSEARQGPIVSFNVHDVHSHALLLTADDVTVLPLPALTPLMVIDKANTFHLALRDATDPAADRIAAQRTLTEVLAWLWDNAAGPVLDALGHRTAPPEGTDWPRVWWAPSGRLGLLPLHAAGHHDRPGTGRTVMDRVVSAYTPTVRALRHARQRQTAAGPHRSLVVAMPTTPGLPQHGRLQHVAAEAESVAGLLPEPLTLIEPDPGSAAGQGDPALPTHDRVRAELPGRPVVHFACHGEYALDDPSASRLLLHDHARAPLTVGDLAAVDLEGAQLAYLSACHTALNVADHLMDESMHLAGAFQLAGFPRVVGTLWMVDDEVAVEIAEDFYSALRDPRTGHLDLTRAAHALHRATRGQRDRYPGTPSLWAAHLYTGA
ncbi:CHAT domain-containing protein [Streptomyces sp. NPDC056161]|uniref:CHAT domain-containing protein n=1 Tax=Streptomyces sp. NPDC056161 TaxID=3345732 RepID=UPI0035E05D48